MSETKQVPRVDPDAEPLVPQQEAWRTVYLGQLSADLVPFHPEPPEAPEDELTQAALTDPGDVTVGAGRPDGPASFWRVLVVLAIGVSALAVVFWRK